MRLAILCKSGKHCGWCRDRGAIGATFRESVRAVMSAPPDWPTCPHGRPWGYAGNAPPHVPIGLGDLLHIALVRLGADRLWAWVRRGRRCGCAQRRAWLNGNTRTIAAAAIAPIMAWLWSI